MRYDSTKAARAWKDALAQLSRTSKLFRVARAAAETSLDFPIAGIGASAGGLDAVTQMLDAVPANTGMAFILIQHLAPQHPSNLAAILARTTPMLVAEAKDQDSVAEPCLRHSAGTRHDHLLRMSTTLPPRDTWPAPAH